MPTSVVQSRFDDVHAQMAPGDVIAFGGDNAFSSLVKRSGRSTVSHCALVWSDPRTGPQPWLIESTVRLERRSFAFGVTSRACAALQDYPGDVWWLPLRSELRDEVFDVSAFTTFLDRVRSSLFDPITGAFIIALGFLYPFRITLPQPRHRGLICCSELVVAALREAALAPNANPKTTSPADVCRWAIYEPVYHQLVGRPRTIPGFNSEPRPV